MPGALDFDGDGLACVFIAATPLQWPANECDRGDDEAAAAAVWLLIGAVQNFDGLAGVSIG